MHTEIDRSCIDCSIQKNQLDCTSENNMAIGDEFTLVHSG